MCTHCSSTLVWTTYCRSMKRNEKTHRSKQAYIPVGKLCLHCGFYQDMLSEEERVRMITRRVGLQKRLMEPEVVPEEK